MHILLTLFIIASLLCVIFILWSICTANGRYNRKLEQLHNEQN